MRPSPCPAVWPAAVVGKAQLVATLPRIQHPVCVDTKQVAVVRLVICCTTPVSLLLCQQLPHILTDEITFGGMLRNEGSPA